ncbi:MAG: 2,3-diaminopropionate biosynthesis protein SbnA [Catenulispora sp.]|nr:2,3-diaminopropionate biosynthesis protein SbnA [Catenulispora sp.]
MTAVASEGLPGLVGRTPLVELENLVAQFRGRVLAKLERFNPGGSVKDRTALSIVLGAIRRGRLEPGRSVVVESSSGNLGIGLAQVCRHHGLRFICVVDVKATAANRRLLRAYGAELDVVTEPDPDTGEYLSARLRRVREIVENTPEAFWPDQYANPDNPRAHRRTMAEIDRALGGRLDYLFVSVGTFGTLRGCAEYVRERGLATRIIGVDAVGSVIFGQPPGPRLLPGHGAGVRPPLADAALADDVLHISDAESVAGCRALVEREGILAGGSSGAVTAALLRYHARLPQNSTCVLICPDGGDRYLDTIYDDAWVRRHFGDVRHPGQEMTTEAGLGTGHGI